MSAGILLWAVAVSVLCAAGGALGAVGAGALGLPVRGIRAAALVASLLIPIVGTVGARPDADAVVAATSAAATGTSITIEDAGLPAAATDLRLRLPAEVTERLARGNEALLLLVLGGALLGLTLLAGGLLRLRLRAPRWRPAQIRGREVRIAERFGPAVVGAFRPRIVLPHTFLRLEAARLEIVLRHEEAHRDGRDPLLLWIGSLMVHLAPWNPVLWWQFARLREAVEFDCDARVLRSGVAPRRYGRLLIDVASSRSRGPILGAPALLESSSSLERRLRRMTTFAARPRPLRALLAASLAAALVFVACDTPAPTVVDDAPESALAALGPASLAGLSDGEKASRIAEVEAEDPGVRWQVRGRVVDEIPAGSELSTVIGAKRFEHPDGDGLVLQLSERPLSEGVDPGPISDILPPETRTQELASEIERTLGHTTPLVIVDGVITSWTLADIAEGRRAGVAISSLEVVKGSVARERWGARAEGGVVLVTTRDADSTERELVPPPAPVDILGDDGTVPPLLVIDGVITDASIGGIGRDGHDWIESIEVLKGAAAHARYGARGAGGVVMIRSKEGAVIPELPRRGDGGELRLESPPAAPAAGG